MHGSYGETKNAFVTHFRWKIYFWNMVSVEFGREKYQRFSSRQGHARKDPMWGKIIIMFQTGKCLPLLATFRIAALVEILNATDRVIYMNVWLSMYLS